ncbi:hypothetical protein HG530_005948 [Fusarium avenaceum]|nr:hypothetical protein HG530_005948 [Fusarium avenaceum]
MSPQHDALFPSAPDWSGHVSAVWYPKLKYRRESILLLHLIRLRCRSSSLGLLSRLELDRPFLSLGDHLVLALALRIQLLLPFCPASEPLLCLQRLETLDTCPALENVADSGRIGLGKADLEIEALTPEITLLGVDTEETLEHGAATLRLTVGRSELQSSEATH